MTQTTNKNKRALRKTAALPVTAETGKQAKKQRSDRLRELLYRVNLIQGEPKDFFETFELVQATAKRLDLRYVGGRGQSVMIPEVISTDGALARALSICLEDQPELAAYIYSREGDEKWYWYIFIRDAHERLRVLIQGLPEPTVEIDDEGVFRERRNTFAETIDGVKEKNLRQCAREDCRRIFLAKKPNQQYCNPKCANVVKNRRFRHDQKEKEQHYLKAMQKKRASKRA